MRGLGDLGARLLVGRRRERRCRRMPRELPRRVVRVRRTTLPYVGRSVHVTDGIVFVKQLRL
jgi:hypothetical protein